MDNPITSDGFNFESLIRSGEVVNRDAFVDEAQRIIAECPLNLCARVEVVSGPVDESLSKDDLKQDKWLREANDVFDQASADWTVASLQVSAAYDPLMRDNLETEIQRLTQKLESAAQKYKGILLPEQDYMTEDLQQRMDEETAEFFRMRIFEFKKSLNSNK